MGKDLERPVKRLKYSRVSRSLEVYNEECKIHGIKDIDLMNEKVEKSKQKLVLIDEIINEIKTLTEGKPYSDELSKIVRDKIDQAKITLL